MVFLGYYGFYDWERIKGFLGLVFGMQNNA